MLHQAKLAAQTKQIKALTAEVRMLGGKDHIHTAKRASAYSNGAMPECGASAWSLASSNPFSAGHSDWMPAGQLPSFGGPHSRDDAPDRYRSQQQSDGMGQVDILDVNSNATDSTTSEGPPHSAASVNSKQAGGLGAAPASLGSAASAENVQAATPYPSSDLQQITDADDSHMPLETLLRADAQEHEYANADQQLGCVDVGSAAAEQPAASAAVQMDSMPTSPEPVTAAAVSRRGTSSEPHGNDSSSLGRGSSIPEAQPSLGEEPDDGDVQLPSNQQDGGAAQAVADWVPTADNISPRSDAAVAEQPLNAAAGEGGIR